MIEHMTLKQWQAFDAQHPAPTFFARPPWAMALAQANPLIAAAPLRVRVAPGEWIVLPLVRMSGGRLRWREYCGFPMGGYTCFLREDGTVADSATAARALSALGRYADAATIVPWPLGPLPSSACGAQHETAVVDLRDGLDAALARVAGIFRRMAGQAERRGVQCAPSRESDAVDTYYELLEASAKRWGLQRPSISKALIEALVAHGGTDVEVWFARVDGRAIGGGIVFYGCEEFFFWSAAMDAEYGRLRPSNALNFALLRAAADRGMLWYNLGSSEGLPGVAKFKDNLGARSIAYSDLHTARAPFKLYENVRRVFFARVSA